jgi:hypothetical protein
VPGRRLGIARLSPVPPPGVRRLALVGDGICLIQLPLGPSAARGLRAAPPATGSPAIPPGERLLMLAAERILASGDARGPVEDPGPGEIITVLTEAGAIAAVCQRLGAAGHGITVSPPGEIPTPWASVLARRDAPVPAGRPEVFAPLAVVLSDVDGARFALAGLSTAAGESHLHVISSGMPQLTDWFAYNWTPGFSWRLRDGAGYWHVAAAGEPWTFGDGMHAFRLRLTPPLTTVPDAAEVVVTGPAPRYRFGQPRDRAKIERAARPVLRRASRRRRDGRRQRPESQYEAAGRLIGGKHEMGDPGQLLLAL